LVGSFTLCSSENNSISSSSSNSDSNSCNDSDHSASDSDGLTKHDTSETVVNSETTNCHVSSTIEVTTKHLLASCDQKVLYPTFPYWDKMLSNAREKATKEAQEELLRERASASATPIALRDKNHVRRERNRLSARMSRLRKRLRHEYLEMMITLLDGRIELLNGIIEKSNNGVIEKCSEKDTTSPVSPVMAPSMAPVTTGYKNIKD
jgi:hypothetical protein